MRISGSTIAFAMMLALVCGDALAQTDPPATPEDATELLIAATRNQDWDGIAALMHPDALSEMADLFAPIFEHEYGEEARDVILGLSSPDEYERLTEADIFARVMRFSLAQNPDLIELMRTSTAQVLGRVDEGPDIAHVLFRMSMSMEGITVSVNDVASFKRYGGGWLGLLKGEFSALAAGLRQMLPPEV